MAKVLSIPRLNDSSADFEQLFSLWSQANDYFEDIRFDFSGCHFLRPNAVAFLGGLARLVESRMGTVVFDWDTLRNNALLTNVSQNGFGQAFDYPALVRTGSDNQM